MRRNIVNGIGVCGGWLLSCGLLLGQSAPNITSVNPNSTPFATPVTVQITGTGFNTSCTRVVFRGQELATSVVTVGLGQIASANIPFSLVTTAGTFPIGVIRYNVIAGTVPTCGTSGTASNTLPFTIQPSPPNITTEIFSTNLNVCTAFQQTVTASGGVPPYTWSATGLPTGISINSSTGVISGTPTAPGQFPATIRVTDTQPVSDQVSLTYNVAGNVLGISTQVLPQGTVGTAYNQTMQSQGVSGSPSWAITADAPPGLSINPTTGVLIGTPTTAGTFQTVFRLSDACRTVTKTIPITINQGANLSITTQSLPAGTQGVPYNTTVTAANGIGTLTWSATGLPTGLAIGQTTGTISGTPAVSGSFNVTVQVTDSQQRTATRSYTLAINAGLSITTLSLNPATVGASYFMQLTASGGIGTLLWSASGLPAGLTMNGSTGAISGTPTTAGTFPVTVQVVDSQQRNATRSYSLQVSGGITILTESPLPSARVGSAYTQILSASGGITPYRFLALEPLPPGLSLDAFGNITGTPTQAGSFNFTVQVFDAVNATSTKTFQLTVTVGFSITTPGLPNGTVGVFYNQTLSSVGGRAPVRWGEESGQLPLGLVLNANTGALTGTPQQAGEFTFTIFAIDADQQRVTRTFTMTIRGNFRITTESLPGGTVDAAYSQTIGTTGGTAPITFTVSEGSLPPGLSLNRTSGVISGTPTAAGTFPFTVQANDAANQSARQSYSVAIVGPPRIVTESLPAGRVGSAYTATVEAAGGETPYRFNATGLPDGLSINASTGAITGTPTRAAQFAPTITVTDRAGRTGSRQFPVTVTAVLTITTTSLPAGTVGTPYAQTLQASGGTGLQWRVANGSLPAGLTLAQSGAISGTPRSAGQSNFTVEVRDSGGSTATRALAITVNALGLGTVNISLSLTTVGPTDQPSVRVQLAEPAPTTLLGTLTLAFTGVADNKRDAQFSQRDTTFRIPQGQTNAVFAEGLAVQIGTVAGTINITAALTAGGVNVTPSPAPSISITVPRQAPVITSMSARREGNTLTVVVDGYSTTREVSAADVQFAIRQGATVQATAFTVQTGPAFTTYFNGDSSNQLGGMFRLTLPFNVTGAAEDITGVTLTLVNAVGRSASRTASF